MTTRTQFEAFTAWTPCMSAISRNGYVLHALRHNKPRRPLDTAQHVPTFLHRIITSSPLGCLIRGRVRLLNRTIAALHDHSGALSDARASFQSDQEAIYLTYLSCCLPTGCRIQWDDTHTLFRGLWTQEETELGKKYVQQKVMCVVLGYVFFLFRCPQPPRRVQKMFDTGP